MISWYEEPVTNRINGRVRFQVKDFRRILENALEMFSRIQNYGYISGDVTVFWRNTIDTIFQNPHNYIVERALWQRLLTDLTTYGEAINYYPSFTLTEDMTYTNMNNVERFILEMGDAWEQYPNYARIKHYFGDANYSGDEINAGGYYV